MSPSERKVLILDDLSEQFDKLRKYLTAEGFACERAKNHDELAHKLNKAQRDRQWYSFVMIDIDLDMPSNGIHVYESISHDFPNETYIIYTSQDVDRFRNEINRLRFRDVGLVLLDEVVNKKNIELTMSRLIQSVVPNRVFLVSGRNETKNQKIRKLLEDCFGLEVIIWEQARESVKNPRNYIFEIVLNGIEMSHLTLVLFTDDEDVTLRNEFVQPSDPEHTGHNRRQSRPNVYIEAGYAMGVRPKRTIFLEWVDDKEHFSSPSDFAGMHVVKYDDSPGSRDLLRQRFEAARCNLKLDPNWKDMSL